MNLMDLLNPGMVLQPIRHWIRRNFSSCASPGQATLCEERSGPCSLLTLRSAQDRELNLKCDYGASFYFAARTD